ncbi:MAG: glycosyltransferase family 4 protein, partial [Anaerolineae bacterium]|nr:glycosyltransferase family 4 protein [Anaerolineae bacterium]
ELQARGHQVLVLAKYENAVWKSEDLVNFVRLSVGLDRGVPRLIERLVRRVQYELKIPYAAFFESLRFVQACRQELTEFDLLYERMGWMGYAGSWASRKLGMPLILEVNGDHLPEFEMLGLAPRGIQRHLSTILTRWAAHQAVHSVATGDGWARKFCQRWGVNSQKISVVENGSQLVDLLDQAELKAFQNEIAGDEPVVSVYVGAFEPWHGLDVLLRAVSRLGSAAGRLKLLLIGTGTMEEQLRNLVGALNLEKQVIFTGHLTPDGMAARLREAEIGFSPYCGRTEYSGLKLIDYKAAGLATIASGIDGQPAVIDDEKTGLIVSPCDEEALCQAIAHLIENPERRKRMGRNARYDAEHQHSWRNTVNHLEEIFEKTVSKAARQ